MAIVNLDPYVPSRTFCGVVGGLFRRLAERAPADVPVPQSCFAAMIEVRGRHACNDELAAADAQNLLRYCRRIGAIAGQPGSLPPLLCEITPAEGWTSAMHPGRASRSTTGTPGTSSGTVIQSAKSPILPPHHPGQGDCPCMLEAMVSSTPAGLPEFTFRLPAFSSE